jgi:hypothetical protein
VVNVRDNCDIANPGIQISFNSALLKNGVLLFYLELRVHADGWRARSKKKRTAP